MTVRKWFNLNKNHDKSINVELSRLKRFYFALGLQIGGDGVVGGTQVFQWHLAIPYLFQIFISLDWTYLKRWPVERKCTEFYIDDQLMHLEIWQTWGEWTRGDWSWGWLWRDKLSNWILGKQSHLEVILSKHEAMITMPEGDYKAEITMTEHTWKRPRSKAKIVRYADVEVEGGIPFPGKGTCSWNCGDDALEATSFKECTVEEACEQFRDAVMDYRDRYPL